MGQKGFLIDIGYNPINDTIRYILYNPSGHFDGLELHERIELVNSYILLNYKEYDRIDEYIILELIN